MDTNKREIEKENIRASILGKMFPDEHKDETDDFTVLVNSYAYSVACMNLLVEYPITPCIAAEIAKHYLIYHPKPRASIMVINRKNKVKEIVDFARDYRAKLTDFTQEITLCCNDRKSQKCIVIYNYEHKVSTYQELMEIEKLYNDLAENGITLVDAIKVTGGKSTRLISRLNSDGYKKSKNVR